MNKDQLKKQNELDELEIAERSRRDLHLASQKNIEESGKKPVSMLERKGQEFKTPGENYEKNCDKIQIPSGGAMSEEMRKFEDKKERYHERIKEQINSVRSKEQTLSKGR